MNERIRKLLVKFKEVESQHRGLEVIIGMNEIEKFAELVVKACADAADMAQDAGCEYAGDYVAEYMGFGEQEGVTEWRAK
jgi:hypothetical protein